jgi:phage tail P2-like protein
LSLPSVYQSIPQAFFGQDVLVVNIPASVQPGDILVVALATNTPAAVPTGTSDLLVNYFYPIFPFTAFDGLTLTILAVQSLAGQDTVTINLAVPAGTAVVTILELQDADMTPLLTTGSASNQSISLNSTVSTPSILIGTVYSDGVISGLNGGWIPIAQTNNLLVVYQVVTALASTQYSLTAATAGENWMGAITSFPVILPNVEESMGGFTFGSVLSPVLAGDTSATSMAKALDYEFQLVTQAIPEIEVFTNVSGQPDAVLDYLALQLRTYAYSTSYPRETKIALIQNALPFNASIGTVATMEKILFTVFGDVEVVEWWQYGAPPYHFALTLTAAASIEVQIMLTAIALALKPASRAFDGFVVASQSYETIYVGGGAMHIAEHYVGTPDTGPLIGFPPLWTPADGPLSSS